MKEVSILFLGSQMATVDLLKKSIAEIGNLLSSVNFSLGYLRCPVEYPDLTAAKVVQHLNAGGVFLFGEGTDFLFEMGFPWDFQEGIFMLPRGTGPSEIEDLLALLASEESGSF